MEWSCRQWHKIEIFVLLHKGEFLCYAMLTCCKFYAKSALLYSKGGIYASDFGIKPPHVYTKVNSHKVKFYARVKCRNRRGYLNLA